MSYNAMGSYYEFTPHEVYSGVGAYYYDGFGAVKDTFNPNQILADIAKSDLCYGPGGACTGANGMASSECKAIQGSCNFAGQRANKEIAAALNALGYGPIAVDGTLSWQSAYNKYLSDNGLTKGPGFGITKQALLTMKQQLVAGTKPGPGPAVEHKKVNGEYIPVEKPEEKPGLEVAGMSGGTLLLAAAVVGGLGYLAYRKGKKKKGAPPPRTKAMQLV